MIKSTSLQSTDLPQLADESELSSAIARNSVVTSPMQDSVPQSSPDDDYECSECFGSYKEDKDMRNGAEWVQCGCSQWIHEDCIGNTVMVLKGCALIVFCKILELFCITISGFFVKHEILL